MTSLKTSFALASALFASTAAFAQAIPVSNEAELKSALSDTSADIVLTQDITLSGEWIPIGTKEAPYMGTFDGKGHAIKGLTITTKADNLGFFSFIGSTATVKNVSFTGAKVLGNKQAAIVAGQAENATISNVYVSGIVTGYDHVGTIVGDARGDANVGADGTTISNCVSTAAAFSSDNQAGGIAGWTNLGVFEYNVAYGAVTAPNGGAAGICSMIDNNGHASFIGNVSAIPYAKGGNNRTSGILGWKNGSGCAIVDDDQNLSSDATQYFVGGNLTAAADIKFDENNEGINGIVTPAADLKTAATYTTAGFSADVWNLVDGQYPTLKTQAAIENAIYTAQVPSRYVVGTEYDTQAASTLGSAVTITSSNPSVVAVEGTTLKFEAQGDAVVTFTAAATDVAPAFTTTLPITVGDINYAITTPADLMAVKYNMAGDFTLENDIDMTGVDFTPIGIEGNTSVAKFTGNFDGKGHIIKGLKYDNADKGEVGLFSQTENATITNLGIEGAHFVGNANVGGIVGRMYGGVIANCATLNSYIEGRDHVASIAGEINNTQDGETLNGGTVSNCFSDAVVKSREYQAGGIVGTITCGTVENNLFTGTVDDRGCATGMVALVDRNDAPSIIHNNVVAASHLYGEVHRIVNTAGRDKAQLENNYVLETTYCGANAKNAGVMENATDATSENGANATLDQLRSQSFYEDLGFDFADTWKFLDDAEGKTYPVLKWMQPKLPTTIFDIPAERALLYDQGMEFFSFAPIHASYGQDIDVQIVSGGDKATINNNALWAGDESGSWAGAGPVVLKANIASDVASLFNTTNADAQFTINIARLGEGVDISTGQELVEKIKANPSGVFTLVKDIDMSGIDLTDFCSNDAFSGTLDGNGHVVRNASVSYTNGENKGIFCTTNGATIKNVAFVDFNVSASSANHVGFIGSAAATKFDQVYVQGKVSGDDHVALLAGDADNCTVTNTFTNGTLVGGSQIGGFFGCTLEGGADIQKSYFNGSLTATKRGWVGGFIGLIDKANSEVTIGNCVSIGDCQFSQDAGGSPKKTGPFIAGNSAGDTPNAKVNFSRNNISNNSAIMSNESDWPDKNPTTDGDNPVGDAQEMAAQALQTSAPYEGLGWDFEKVWTMDAASGYLYPTLKIFDSFPASGVKDLQNDVKATFVAAAADNVLTVAGLDAAATVTVANVAGQTVAMVSTATGAATIQLPGKGLYLVKATVNGKTATAKVLNK
ncbi:ZmpA/ZmpB/ZmpC family metallo-endopeptidase-related protein [Prevotella sp.]|uniref:ZmpA/ZmpB/ZmpC family metallo-endopeptidase-related protein n=1 Tax=Prevotella sp. TaxID=59823 RepID=UPI003077CCA0